MRKIIQILLSCVALTAAANVCTWRGPSGGRWSVAANWDVAPVAGRGDVLVFSNAVSGTVLRTQNDLANLRLSGLRIPGTNPVSVFGAPIDFGSGSSTITNSCLVTNAAATTISGTGSLIFRGKGTMVVTGPVTGSAATLVNARGNGVNLVDFRAAVQVQTVKSSIGYGELRFSATGNSWETFTVNPLGTFGAGAENALPVNMVLAFADAYRENRTDIAGLHLNGWNQTIDRISSSTNAYRDLRWESDHVRSDFAATLTLRGTADARERGLVAEADAGGSLRFLRHDRLPLLHGDGPG